jgi:hypothetical protein
MRIEQLDRDVVTKERYMANQDQDMPNRASNMEKAEGDRKSDTPDRTPETEKGGGERKSEWGAGTSSGGGTPNRPMGEEHAG